jgi:hypothetical protein
MVDSRPREVTNSAAHAPSPSPTPMVTPLVSETSSSTANDAASGMCSTKYPRGIILDPYPDVCQIG